MAGKQTQSRPPHSERNKYVRAFDESSRRHLVAVNVNGKIHIFHGEVRKMIVRCPGTPSVFELWKDQNGQWQIWVVTHGKDIYRKELRFASSLGNELMEVQDVNTSNQSIFGDLLNDSEPDLLDLDTGHCKSSDDDVCEICEENKVLSCSGDVISICSTGEFLAVVCIDRSETVALIYCMNELQTRKCESANQRLYLPFCKLSDEKKSLRQILKLTVVTSDSTNCSSSSELCVPSHVFSLLFGWEMSVRSLSVIVCSMTDGSVYFHPVDMSAHNPEPSWRLLCVVDSPVIDILFIKLNRTLSERESVTAELHAALGFPLRSSSHTLIDALLVVGASGKCCLLSAMPTLGASAGSSACSKVISMFTLPGSVNSVCCRDHVLYTCGHAPSVDKCSLTLMRPDGRDRNLWSVEVKSDQLFSASVSFMWFSGQEDTLLCQTINGDLIEIECTLPPAADTVNSKALLQPSLKDLLVGVDISQSQINELKSTQVQYNTFLQQMNMAAHLLQQIRLPCAADNQNVPPISCRVTLLSDIDYHVVKYYLCVEVMNHTAVPLTKDWSVVTVLHQGSGKLDSYLLKWQHRDLPSTHTFKLSQGLGGGCRIHFKIPATYSPTCCGLKVDVSLMLHMPDIQQKEISELDSERNCLFVPVTASVVDIFHFFHLKQAGSTVPLSADAHFSVEKQIAELRCCGQKLFLSEKKPAGQIYSTSECISVSAESGISTAVEFLHTLLKDSQVKTDVLVHPSCSLQAPCGSVLMLNVDSTTQPNTFPGSSDDGMSYTVTMKTSDISLMARARLALARRLQDIGTKHRGVNIEEFRKTIRKTESFQQQLQGIQERLGKGDNNHTDTLSELSALYEIMQNYTEK